MKKLSLTDISAVVPSTLLVAMMLLIGSGFVACSADRVSQPQMAFAEAGEEPSHAVDIVKLISVAIPEKNSEKTYFQPTYDVGSESRLLLRYKALPFLTTRIQADQPVRLRIYLAEGQSRAGAAVALRVCPVRSQWNMSATWNSGGLRGDWTPGGDLDSDACVAIDDGLPQAAHALVSAKPTREAIGLCTEPDALCFDVSRWYHDYVLGRGSFDGLALISSDGRTVRVIGETAGLKAPWLAWTETVAVQ